MIKQANPTTIGAFVLGGVVLLATATMIFGGSEIFARQDRMVAYFPGSVKGLRNGANVLFRGVRIGYVEDIQLQGDADTGLTLVQVIMRINPDQYHVTRNGVVVSTASGDEDTNDLIDESSLDLIDSGLRAQLGVESFVTGQLVVEFDFFPGSEETYRAQRPPYPEIPTIPNNIEQLVENVQRFVADIQQNLDIVQVSKDVQTAIAGISELANSAELKNAISGVDRLVNSDDAQQLARRLSATLTDARAALQEARSLMAGVGDELGPVAADLQSAMSRLDSTMAVAEDTLRSAGEQIRGDTQLAYRVIGTLEEVESAARSLRVFVDYLERNPEALLRGKRN